MHVLTDLEGHKIKCSVSFNYPLCMSTCVGGGVRVFVGIIQPYLFISPPGMSRGEGGKGRGEGGIFRLSSYLTTFSPQVEFPLSSPCRASPNCVYYAPLEIIGCLHMYKQ